MDDRRPFIDFYEMIGFAPTRRSTEADDSHRAHREFLFQSLGLPDLVFRGRDVVEFGPGSGENADRILEMEPSSLTFVDASEAVLNGLETRHQSMECDSSEVRYVLCSISDFVAPDGFDIVLCEGVIPLQFKPRSMAATVLQCVRPGGAVVLTCFDSVSGFSEISRRFIAHSVFGHLTYSLNTVDRLTRFFEPDFSALPGMSRRREDWVIDSIINPWLGDFFSLEDALSLAKSDFAFLGASPSLFQDWRWYKDPSVIVRSANIQSSIDAYRRNVHSLLDARFVCQETPDSSTNVRLLEVTEHIAMRVRGAISSGITYDEKEFCRDVESLMACVPHAHPETIESLSSLAHWARTGEEGDLAQFRGLWGRGQQYISLIRHT